MEPRTAVRSSLKEPSLSGKHLAEEQIPEPRSKGCNKLKEYHENLFLAKIKFIFAAACEIISVAPPSKRPATSTATASKTYYN